MAANSVIGNFRISAPDCMAVGTVGDVVESADWSESVNEGAEIVAEVQSD